MNDKQLNVGSEMRVARVKWGNLSKVATKSLRNILSENRLSVSAGDVALLESKWYVTHSGLLRVACSNHCAGIRVEPVSEFCDATNCRWAFKATVYKTRNCKGFVGYGDADPSNVSPLLRGAEMRIAETRAVNRALRKAYGIGTCSLEELGSAALVNPPTTQSGTKSTRVNSNGHLLRDRLNLLIRQHQLDPALVKRYAADFCGTQSLREASRELVEDFIAVVSQKATEDLAGLECQLNSYKHTEVQP